MVAPLSSRILNIEAKANAVSHHPFAAAFHQRSKQYCKEQHEDCSDSASSLLTTPSMTNNKKRSIDEIRYQAANIYEDLTRAKIQYNNKATAEKPRVRLITASKKNPYIEEVITMKCSRLLDSSEYTDLIRACEHFYRIPNNELIQRVDYKKTGSIHRKDSHKSFDGTNSTNSLTDTTESDVTSVEKTYYNFKEHEVYNNIMRNKALNGDILHPTVYSDKIE